MNQNWTVVWDGTDRTRRHLFAPEPASVAPPPSKPYVTATSLIWNLRHELPEWFTVSRLAAETGLDHQRIYNALANLERQGKLEKERKTLMRTTKVQRYRWIR